MHLMHGTARLRCIAPDYGNGGVDYHLMVCPFFGGRCEFLLGGFLNFTGSPHIFG